MDSGSEKYRRRIGFWRTTAFLSLGGFVVTLLALVVIVIVKDRQLGNMNGSSLPCPPPVGGLLTSGDPESPDPFHDITIEEYRRLYDYLRNVKDLNLAPPERAAVNTSNVFMVDLLLPPKKDVLDFLDRSKVQPSREARVVIFRGDLPTPQVEEYRVGPLSAPTKHELIDYNGKRRNPVQFAIRPVGALEFRAVHENIMTLVDKEIGFILKESYGGMFTNCTDDCMSFYPTPVGTNLIGSMHRKIWFWGNYPGEYYSLHPLDFGVRANLDGSQPSQWSVDKVLYSGQLYDSLQELATQYRLQAAIPKTKVQYVHTTKNVYSTLNLRGHPVPDPPQRPPHQVEPDGKRYSIEHRHVHYLNWDFNFRLSAFTGPQLYDVRHEGERIAYELGLSEIAVFYSGNSPVQRVTDFVDSGALLGTHSKSLIPGSDCPEGATFLNVSFLGEAMQEPTTLQRSICVFEQDTGVPLRRHMSYARDQGAFYGGMADSVLVVRSILTVVNYDYIIDFVFHQSGALEVRTLSTGYILSTFWRKQEDPYGFRLAEHISGNIHHHMFHYKADLDILGTDNRYETLDMKSEEVKLTQISPDATYWQTYFSREQKDTEMDAVYKFNFNTPKYHLVHNNAQRTQYDAPRAFRIHISGMSKQLLPEGVDNERSVPWARQQLAVTVRKEEEAVGSSPYAMFDSVDPVTNFTSFFADDERIVDQDLVFWITMGTHHIPHTEDLPNTPTPGGHLAFFLLPYNYFPECPSVSSRDSIRVEYVKPGDQSQGLRVERNGNAENAACGAVTLEQLVKERPDDVIQTHKEFKLL